MSSTLLLRFSSHDRSKIEDTIRMLKDDLESQQKQKDEEKRMVSCKNLILTYSNYLQQLVKKPPLSVRISKYVKNPKEIFILIWHGIIHTFHGFRLFALETRLSMKYVLKLLRGQSLNRKERQQVYLAILFFSICNVTIFSLCAPLRISFAWFHSLFLLLCHSWSCFSHFISNYSLKWCPPLSKTCQKRQFRSRI